MRLFESIAQLKSELCQSDIPVFMLTHDAKEEVQINNYVHLDQMVSTPCPYLNVTVRTQIPDNGLNRLSDRILLFRHDYCSPNVLQLINSASDVTDETLVEIVLTANREYECQ